MPKLGKPVELQSIAQINSLPTFQNDPDGPLSAVDAKRWRGTTLEIIVSKQEALNRMKTLALPQATRILLETSSLGDGKLYLRMYFKFEDWDRIKAMMIGVGFTYRSAPGDLPRTGHIGEFFFQ
jgi:hypothetical protein